MTETTDLDQPIVEHKADDLRAAYDLGYDLTYGGAPADRPRDWIAARAFDRGCEDGWADRLADQQDWPPADDPGDHTW